MVSFDTLIGVVVFPDLPGTPEGRATARRLFEEKQAAAVAAGFRYPQETVTHVIAAPGGTVWIEGDNEQRTPAPVYVWPDVEFKMPEVN